MPTIVDLVPQLKAAVEIIRLAEECHDKLASVGLEVAAFLDAHPEIQGEWRERLAWRCVGEDLTPFMHDLPDKCEAALAALSSLPDVTVDEMRDEAELAFWTHGDDVPNHPLARDVAVDWHERGWRDALAAMGVEVGDA